MNGLDPCYVGIELRLPMNDIIWHEIRLDPCYVGIELRQLKL